MKYKYYTAVYTADDLSRFEFVSLGKKGMIRKRIEFAKTDVKGIYNLAFGNIGAENRLEDDTITDNGDRDMILATLAEAIDKYTQRYPRRWIYFSGNTPAKTRLYRMAIGLNLGELLKKFEIYADVEHEEDFIPFQRNMVLEGFLIRRRVIFQQGSI
jgi:hypothetical protein